MKLAKKLLIKVGSTGRETRVFDAETGEPIRHVHAVALDASVEDVRFTVIFSPTETITVEGEPRWIADVDQLEELAKNMGFILVERNEISGSEAASIAGDLLNLHRQELIEMVEKDSVALLQKIRKLAGSVLTQALDR